MIKIKKAQIIKRLWTFQVLESLKTMGALKFEMYFPFCY